MSTHPPLAFSYQRFSSPRQAEGDSVRRQTAARDDFLRRRGLGLDESLQFRDEGVSSFRGRHRDDRHELGRFLGLVKAGRVPKGSFLIVESLDRLSREDIQPALLLLLSLLQAGVRVVQLLPVEQVFDSKSDSMALMMAIMELSRGNSESRVKSERVAASWERRRQRTAEQKVPISGRCPAWLRRSGERYEVVEEKAAVVRRLFEWAAAGYGVARIVKRLAAEKTPVLGTSGKWHAAYLHRVLTGRAVLGDYQPTRDRKPFGDPIPGVYPAVIDERLYHRAQGAIRERRTYPGGHSPNGVNLFTGLLRHAEDGDTFEFKWVRQKNRKPAGRYVNSRSLAGERAAVTFLVEPFERAVLECLTEIDPREVLPDAGPAVNTVVDLEAEDATIADQLCKLEDRLVEGGGSATIEGAIRRLERRQQEVRDRLAVERTKALTPAVEALGQTRSLITALAAAPDHEEARRRLQKAMRRAVTEIRCLPVRDGTRQINCVQIHFTGGGVRTIFVCYRFELVNTAERVPAFLRWTTVKDELPGGVDLRLRRFLRAVRAVLAKMVTEDAWHAAWEPERETPTERLKTAQKRNYWRTKQRRGDAEPPTVSPEPPPRKG